MSIIEQINRIKQNIANAYTACQELGVTLPANLNSENLSSAIESIPSGSEKRYNLDIGSWWGDVNEDGELRFPVSQDLIANGVVTIGPYLLICKYYGGAWAEDQVRGIKSVLFPDLKTIESCGMGQFCTRATDLETVSFPELLSVGQCGLQEAFAYNKNLRSISLPKLKTLAGGHRSLSKVCNSCQNLESVNLDSLEELNVNGLESAFGGTKLTTLSFPSLHPQSFGVVTDQFFNMLSNVKNCTVHFPFCIEEVIGQWADVLAGFNGKNTVVLFDLHKANITFTVNPSSSVIIANGRTLTGTSVTVPSGKLTYVCYAPTTNTLLFAEVNDIQDDAYETINVNIPTATKKAYLELGISNYSSNITFKVGNYEFHPQESSTTGRYEVGVVGNGTIKYDVNGGDTKTDAAGSITVGNGNALSLATLQNCRWTTFVAPVLTSNGVLGGDSFAVRGNDDNENCYQPFSEKTTDYWAPENDVNYYTIYNPQELKISSLTVTYTSSSTSYVASQIILQASFDNEDWFDLAEIGYEAGQERIITVNSTRGYKYHRLVVTAYSSWLRIKGLAFTAVYKEII